MRERASARASRTTGAHLRARRQELGLRQAQVAADVGISPSYLNLIEHDRRKPGHDVLQRMTEVLRLDPSSIDPNATAVLVDDLRAAAAATGAGQAAERAEDLAARFPDWAEVLTRLHRRSEGLERTVEALSDRMSHDPRLSAAVHEVLSAVASVRSTAAILAETEDIDPEWRARFHHNLDQDSARLAQGARALVTWLDAGEGAGGAVQGGAVPGGIAAPQEEAEAWFAAHGWQGSAAAVAQPAGDAVPGADLSAAARIMVQDWAAQADRDAAAMPLAGLRALPEDQAADPARLAARFGVSILTAMRRLAMLPGAKAGLVLCDASGAPTLRKPVEGFALPRHGAGCPLWPLYAALGRPMVPVDTVVETAGHNARRFRVLAYCELRAPQTFNGPELRQAAMLILPDPAPAGPALPVGPTCRICPRADCVARREPSILQDAD